MLRPAPTELFFKGRSGDPRLGELVKPLGFPSQGLGEAPKGAWAVVGCPDDTGVVRNRGRAGAALGPDAIRNAFYRMTPGIEKSLIEKLSLFDAGNVAVSSEIRETHLRAFRATADLAKAGYGILLLGGGHDFAAPGILGLCEGLEAGTSVGIINIDPHLDVRDLESGLPHSGTPFRVILESGKVLGKNLVEFGTRHCRNSLEHFEYCKEKGVVVDPFEVSTQSDFLPRFEKHLQRLAKSVDVLALTVDMDSCSDAEGTSAAPALGFSTRELLQMVSLCSAVGNVRYFEIAEVAPNLDPSGRTSRIAAELLYAFLEGRYKQTPKKIPTHSKKSNAVGKNERKRKK